jgi:hypothetical protein
MANLTIIEKRKLERVFGMGSGYVLSFSDRTFQEFFADVVGIDIYNKKYDYASGSKANRLRGFWTEETNHIVGKVLNALLDVYKDDDHSLSAEYDDARQIAARLLQDSPVIDIDAIAPITDDKEFEMLAQSVRDAIEENQPQSGLDRLHTFLVKFVRVVAMKRGVECDKDKPLQSIFGEYVKVLKRLNLLESEMAERILKSTIANFEAFNRVRNDRSLAHDNQTLEHAESILILNSVASTIRFIKAVERIGEDSAKDAAKVEGDFPF